MNSRKDIASGSEEGLGTNPRRRQGALWRCHGLACVGRRTCRVVEFHLRGPARPCQVSTRARRPGPARGLGSDGDVPSEPRTQRACERSKRWAGLTPLTALEDSLRARLRRTNEPPALALTAPPPSGITPPLLVLSG